MASRYDFLVDMYDTERLKTLSVWAQIPAERLTFRVEPRARTPLEHMVHQCVSEEGWMRTMLGVDVGMPALPNDESARGFVEHFARATEERLRVLRKCDDRWFEDETGFFEVRRPRAWVFTRRLTHSAHHRGQLTTLIRVWGQSLYSTYGPTADTGGLPKNGARVVYRFASVDAVLQSMKGEGGPPPEFPKPNDEAVTERARGPSGRGGR